MFGVILPQRLSKLQNSILVVAVLGCLTIPGCGLAPSEPTGKVEGVLKHNGETAVAGTTVMFLMNSKGLGAVGEVEEDGKFVVKMAGTDQIPAGTYSVSVRPSSGPEITPEERMEALKNKKPQVDYEIGVPKKYRTPETSGVTFEVKTGDNQFELDMKDE